MELFPERSSLSPPPKGIAVAVSKPVVKKAYRPPHARGTAAPEIYKRGDEGKPVADNEKRRKGLERKLQQIAELKARKERGDALELTQESKIASEEQIRQQLAMLGV